MNLIEITYPQGALEPEARTAIAERIATGLLGTDEIPPETLRRARRMTHVLFHEAASWSTGDGPVDDPPPYLVTITVPEAWRADVSRPCMGIVRAALRRHDEARGHVRAGGDVWITVVGIADGDIGLNGSPATARDVVNYMTEEYRAAERPDEDLPDGVVRDPICGMRVRLGPSAITLERDGKTVGFCAVGCRDTYAANETVA
ncbi:hypothetical protein [Actinokineospora fastidiosa]|uniref:Uncharacterized protein n=1 Tax=Actinokineospora fastidiosa TaxID=1816 RepID=A0A918GI80_9PSEU|nr:hypothetical protein [Actinokineospora fastidiosa]GGS39272.1 hypothetical protein GCM10010171_37890 [Actinokineospora fastidiosa]